MSGTFERITRAQFVATPLAPGGGDRFAKTFLAKADAMGLWSEDVVGLLDEDGCVKTVLCVKLTRREPVVANLQLLHTFAKHRRLGYAAALVRYQYQRIAQQGFAKYFRVSSEHDAVDFYRSLGLKFWGVQKSGSLLCIHQITSLHPRTGNYAMTGFMQKQLHSGRRGALVESFSEPY